MSLPETCSEGGPVIAIPAELASSWGGVDNGDYDRACSAEDHTNLDYGAIGVVKVGAGRALALDLELLTAFLSTPGGGVIIRNYEEDPITTDVAQAMLAGVQEWTSWGQPLGLEDGRLFLFDSACPGAAEPQDIEAEEGVISANLGTGLYAIHIAVSDGIEFIRLTRTK